MEEDTAVAKKAWSKDLGYYTVWFVIWGAVFSILQPTTGHEPSGFLVQKVVLGAGFGVVCALVFTTLQNGLNTARRKWLSWAFAIVTWVSINLGLAMATGRFT